MNYNLISIFKIFFGFGSNMSNTDTLFEITEKLSHLLLTEQTTALLDIKIALDTADHSVMLENLSKDGIK